MFGAKTMDWSANNTELDEFRHTFSHFPFRYTTDCYISQTKLGGTVARKQTILGMTCSRPPQLGLSAPAKKLIEHLQLALLSRV